MRRTLGLLAITAVLISISTLAVAKGNANFVIGQRSFDEDDFAPVEDQRVLGFNIQFDSPYNPVDLVIGIFRSQDDDNAFDPLIGPFTIDTETLEFSFGVVKVWDKYAKAKPYIGGGVSFIRLDVEASALGMTVGDDDSDTGFYANGGIFWRFGEWFNIGIDARILVGAKGDLITGSGDPVAETLTTSRLV